MAKENIRRKIQNVIGGIAKNVNQKKWQCLADGCTQNAINSHLLMRHGILNHVAENGKLVELKTRAIEALSPGQLPVCFKEVGINQAISYPLFCNSHDTALFSEIEIGEVDYSVYRNIVLYSYRAICAEIRKKDIEAEKLRRICNSNILSQLMPSYTMQDFNIQLQNMLQGQQELEYYKQELKRDLDNSTESFVFASIEIPITGVYASTTSSLFSTTEETFDFYNPLKAFFFHLIPKKNNSQLILGYHSEHAREEFLKYINEWKNVEQDEIGYKLTGLLLQTESWGLSPSLYYDLLSENIDDFLQMNAECSMSLEQAPIETINLFEGII